MILRLLAMLLTPNEILGIAIGREVLVTKSMFDRKQVANARFLAILLVVLEISL